MIKKIGQHNYKIKNQNKDYKVGDLLKTENGDFLIINVDVYDEGFELVGYGGVYIDDDFNFPPEMQYFEEDFNILIDKINKDGKIIGVIKNYIKNNIST
jgi:hypothetical protein